MNGFNYNPEQKKITITDDTTIVIWENVVDVLLTDTVACPENETSDGK